MPLKLLLDLLTGNLALVNVPGTGGTPPTGGTFLFADGSGFAFADGTDINFVT